MPSIILRSGGQTGVDRAALDIAISFQLAYAGWCPRGGRAEDHPLSPGLLARYPRLCETPSPESPQRTAWNVRDSHATLILVPGPDISKFHGTQFTKSCAELIFLKPCFVADVGSEASTMAVKNWLKGLFLGHPSIESFMLNISGPRESESPGIYLAAHRFLKTLVDAAHRV
jgi:hypothetical protein